MKRAASVIAVLAATVLAASCSSASHPTTPTATTASIASPQLSEESFCSDYLRADSTEQTRFLTAEVNAHVPTSSGTITIPPQFNSGSPTAISSSQFETGFLVSFLMQTLQVKCGQDPGARLGDVLAPAWSTPTP